MVNFENAIAGWVIMEEDLIKPHLLTAKKIRNYPQLLKLTAISFDEVHRNKSCIEKF